MSSSVKEHLTYVQPSINNKKQKGKGKNSWEILSRNWRSETIIYFIRKGSF